LSRNLDDQDFTDEINHEICRLAEPKVLDDMVIAINPGDIRKRHASKMEYLCKIHDGSDHAIGDGYWLAKAVAADIEQYQDWIYGYLLLIRNCITIASSAFATSTTLAAAGAVSLIFFDVSSTILETP